jgi:hypothetical protein
VTQNVDRPSFYLTALEEGGIMPGIKHPDTRKKFQIEIASSELMKVMISKGKEGKRKGGLSALSTHHDQQVAF